MRIILGIIFLIGLIYLILPGPERIEEFPRLPGSLKSQLTGDTIQNPNIAAFFSDYDRAFVTNFYFSGFKNIYCKKDILGFPNPLCFLSPLKLNHPPEKAFSYIRDQQESTYLEEYFLPLRESFFVNGYEPIDKNGKPFFQMSKPIEVDKVIYFSKSTVRFYPSSVWSRVLIYLGIWASFFGLGKLGKGLGKNG